VVILSESSRFTGRSLLLRRLPRSISFPANWSSATVHAEIEGPHGRHATPRLVSNLNRSSTRADREGADPRESFVASVAAAVPARSGKSLRHGTVGRLRRVRVRFDIPILSFWRCCPPVGHVNPAHEARPNEGEIRVRTTPRKSGSAAADLTCCGFAERGKTRAANLWQSVFVYPRHALFLGLECESGLQVQLAGSKRECDDSNLGFHATICESLLESEHEENLGSLRCPSTKSL
jgi:hypothetical protein